MINSICGCIVLIVNGIVKAVIFRLVVLVVLVSEVFEMCRTGVIGAVLEAEKAW